MKKIVIGMIIGILLSNIVVYAAIGANKITYKKVDDTEITVEDAINELYEKSELYDVIYIDWKSSSGWNSDIFNVTGYGNPDEYFTKSGTTLIAKKHAKFKVSLYLISTGGGAMKLLKNNALAIYNDASSGTKIAQWIIKNETEIEVNENDTLVAQQYGEGIRSFYAVTFKEIK